MSVEVSSLASVYHHAFRALGQRLLQLLANEVESHELFARAYAENGWFTETECRRAVGHWANTLCSDDFTRWASEVEPTTKSARVGLILAGNIPLVGFHDVMCTLLCGHSALIKCSSSDQVLMRYAVNELLKIDPRLAPLVKWADGPWGSFDAVIATGTNNSARQFEQYFNHVPNLIRRNRTSLAWIEEHTTNAELQHLMDDVFFYFGLGCRSVTQLLLPKSFDVNRLFAASIGHRQVMTNKKYANNYIHYKTLYTMQRVHVIDNDLLLLMESDALFSPPSVLFFKRYESPSEAQKFIDDHYHELQCVVGHSGTAFGQSQYPPVHEFADGVNTIDFLLKVKAGAA